MRPDDISNLYSLNITHRLNISSFRPSIMPDRQLSESLSAYLTCSNSARVKRNYTKCPMRACICIRNEKVHDITNFTRPAKKRRICRLDTQPVYQISQKRIAFDFCDGSTNGLERDLHRENQNTEVNLYFGDVIPIITFPIDSVLVLFVELIRGSRPVFIVGSYI